MCGSVDVRIKPELFFTATDNIETSDINSSTLTLIASDFCWQGSHCWLRNNKALLLEPGPNNCIVHVQALSWGQPEYYLKLLPSCCPLLTVSIRRAAHCLTGLTSSLAELIKSFKVREVGQISSEHLSSCCVEVPPLGALSIGTGSMAPLRNQHRLFFSPSPSWRCYFGLQTTLHLALSCFSFPLFV